MATRLTKRNRAGVQRARCLRRDMTDAERVLWRHLRLRRVGGLRFRRQYPIGRYVADSACLKARLILEVDGGQHATQQEHDHTRTSEIERDGFRVLRFSNREVLYETEAVVEAIRNALCRLHPERCWR